MNINCKDFLELMIHLIVQDIFTMKITMDYIVDYQLNWSTRRIDYLDSTPTKVSELNLKTNFICVFWFLNLDHI